VRHKSTKSQTP
jgi:hypothetical protein